MLAQMMEKFKGGVSVPHHKPTATMATVPLPAPKLVVIPLQQHIGAPCQPLVKAKGLVQVGQVIADSSAFVSAPIHAPVSGKIKHIKPILLANGKQIDAFTIENDGNDTPVAEMGPVTITNKKELIQAARDSGLVGIGGAGFPLHVKLAAKEPLDTLVINGAECEPYITSDYREAIENTDRIITGMLTVMDQLQIKTGIIGIEDNKPQAITALAEAVNRQPDPNTHQRIKVMKLPTRYPQGAEKMLIYATTGRKVAPGELPASVGCLILNISTISLFQHYLDTGMPLTEKRITVDGDNIVESKNLRVPIGTPIEDILTFCGGLKETAGAKIILGGPMMGIAQFDLTLPITKQTNAITCLSAKTATQPQEMPCIRCGRCTRGCPMNLLPLEIERALKNKDAQSLKEHHVAACMECGCCAFVCPSNRRLVQYMREGKVIERGAQ